MSGSAAPGAPAVARVPAPPRPASTLVLTRAQADGGAGIEVLLMQRSTGADFVPGMYVFPGGGVEAEDASPLAARLSPRLSPAAAQQRLEDADAPAQALGHYVTALRETFEEAGVLLACRPDGSPAAHTAEALASGRRAVAAGELGFLAWLEQAGLCLATEQLIYFAHWITPVAAPKRFDTRFFLAAAPRGTTVHADQTEVVGYRWATPQQALAAHAAGSMPMIEPTLRNLELLLDFATPDAMRAALGQRRVRPVLPLMRIGPDGRRVIIYPWDPAYTAPESS